MGTDEERHGICFVSKRNDSHRAEHDKKPKTRVGAKLELDGFGAGLPELSKETG
jgi:hypothetical protein